MSTERKSWQETLGQVNWAKALFALGTMTSVPIFCFLYFVRDEGLMASITSTFMAFWVAGLGIFAILVAVSISLHFLKLLGI